jgi:hypothetical protein
MRENTPEIAGSLKGKILVPDAAMTMQQEDRRRRGT